MRPTTRALIAGVAVTAVTVGYAAVASTGTKSAHKAPRATFGTPVVVDFFRPGY